MSLGIAPSSKCYTETKQREVKLIKNFSERWIMYE
jgi:hypothetical protein